MFGVHSLIRIPSFCRTTAIMLLEEMFISLGLKKTSRSRRNSAGNAHSDLLEKSDYKVGQLTLGKI